MYPFRRSSSDTVSSSDSSSNKEDFQNSFTADRDINAHRLSTSSSAEQPGQQTLSTQNVAFKPAESTINANAGAAAAGSSAGVKRSRWGVGWWQGGEKKLASDGFEGGFLG
ncbi:hypothetical protein HDV00_008488 [Rhizophlyctis rosea]|nr:hypothetical protein HDV00_008488 [Rhizophlyctis rosea]